MRGVFRPHTGSIMEVVLIVALLLALLAARVPVALALAIPAGVGLILQDMPLVSVIQRLYSGTENWVLTAIPLFVLAGMLMDRGGLSERMVNFSDAVLGFLPGGLANVNIAASMLFGGISGSAVADSSALGSILIPEMRKRGYSLEYSAAITAASSPIGMIIPPSIPMIVWSFISGDSLGDLFLGGILPGILFGVFLMAASTCICIRRGYQAQGTKFRFERLRKSAGDGIVSLMAPAVIIGGIISGVFTATESAMVAVAYSFLVTFLYYRNLKLSDIPGILVRAGKTSASIMFIIGSATALSWVLTIYRVPQTLGAAILDVSGGPGTFMLLCCGLFFVLGMLLDTSTIILLVGPIIAPIIPGMGIDPIHAGLIFMVVLATGLITPPLGLCLFVVATLSKVKLEKIAVECIPFVIMMILLALLMWYVPDTVLFIPKFFA